QYGLFALLGRSAATWSDGTVPGWHLLVLAESFRYLLKPRRGRPLAVRPPTTRRPVQRVRGGRRIIRTAGGATQSPPRADRRLSTRRAPSVRGLRCGSWDRCCKSSTLWVLPL